MTSSPAQTTQITFNIPIAAGAGLLLFLTSSRLYAEWQENPNAEHVAITLPVGLYLLFKAWHRESSASETPAPSWTAGILLGAASLICLWADYRIEEITILFCGIFFALCASSALLVGKGRWQSTWIPLALIAFAAPLPETIATNLIHIHLQRFAAASAGGILALFGIDATVNGTVIAISGNALNIVEQCSGLKFITVLLFASLVIAGEMGEKLVAAKIILTIIAPLVAFITNIARLVIAGVIADRNGMEAVDNFLHGGWTVMALYAGGIFILFMLGELLKDLFSTPLQMDGDSRQYGVLS